MTNRIIAVVLIALSFRLCGAAQSKSSLIGTWKLVSVADTTEKGEVIRDRLGQNPTGFITYTAEGRMMAIITKGGRKPLSTSDFISAPVEERAEAFATLVAYAGSYTFAGDKVIHHVQAAWMQNVVNTDFVRLIVKLDGDHLILRTTPFTRGGLHIAHEDLVWERVKPESASR